MWLMSASRTAHPTAAGRHVVDPDRGVARPSLRACRVGRLAHEDRDLAQRSLAGESFDPMCAGGEERDAAAAILRHVADDVRIRPMTELDIEGITRIDERITKQYRPEVWEQRVGYYIRRDADSSQVAEVGGKVAGFMMGEVRGGEFGLEEPTGWI